MSLFHRIIIGLSNFTNKSHICRATLEAVCFQSREVCYINNNSYYGNRKVQIFCKTQDNYSRALLMLQSQPNTCWFPFLMNISYINLAHVGGEDGYCNQVSVCMSVCSQNIWTTKTTLGLWRVTERCEIVQDQNKRPAFF